MKRPQVTVLMPVYNGARYLREAIESILNQTYEDFEFLIINDGSTDNSLSILNSYAKLDGRIRVVSRPNKGLIATLNEGISLAKGVYIARQDSDDVSMVERLSVQVDFLNANSSVGLVGTNYHTINENSRHLSTTDVFTLPDDIKFAQVFSNQFGHGAVMFRKEILNLSGNYNIDFEHSEDFDLWTRVLRISKGANLKQPLYEWRRHDESTTLLQAKKMADQVNRIRLREFNYYQTHKHEYALFTLNSFSTLGGIKKYHEKKNRLYRNLSLMYCQSGYRRHSIMPILLAIIVSPWVSKSYTQFFYILVRRSRLKNIKIMTI